MSAYELAQRQAEDIGLWCVARHASEDYIQAALRELHAEVERDYQEMLDDQEDAQAPGD